MDGRYGVQTLIEAEVQEPDPLVQEDGDGMGPSPRDPVLSHTVGGQG